MAFERLAFEKTWGSEEDFPTYQDSEAQVRADLQYHPDAVKDFINGLLDVLESAQAAGLIGASVGDVEGTVLDVLNAHLSHLETLDEDVQTVAAGGVPSVSRCSPVTFTTDDWSENTLTIPKDSHNRTSAAFGYALWSGADGERQSNSWYARGTNVVYDAGTEDIVLTAEEGYDGLVVFFGV